MAAARGSAIFVHPQALCESEEVGRGTRVWAFAHVMAGAVVGENCNICDHVFIESGAQVGNRVTVKNAVLIWDRVVVEDDVFLGPNMVFTNDLVPRAAVRKRNDELLATVVRRGATIGANATVVCGIVIGAHSFVGAGAVVVKDVPAHALVLGSPATWRGWVCECGSRLDGDLRCTCGRGHQLADDGSGLQQTGPTAGDSRLSPVYW